MSPGQWGSSAPSGHSGTRVPYIMSPQSLGGIVITCTVEAGSSLVPASGKGTEHGGGTPGVLWPITSSGEGTSAHFPLARI